MSRSTRTSSSSGPLLDSGCTWNVGGPTVRTSGRTQGRTPGGFAGYIRMLVAELEGA